MVLLEKFASLEELKCQKLCHIINDLSDIMIMAH